MKKGLLGIALAAGLVGTAWLTPVSPASAQASGCAIQQAADLAVQKQLALLDAAKVDSSQFFNGVNSCLGSNLLTNLDLSNLIPTSFDFSAAASGLINNVIQQAQQQVCQILNEQLQKIVGKINGQMFDFQSLAGQQMGDLLGSGSSSISSLNIPDLPGMGQYDFTQASVTNQPGEFNNPVVTPPGPQEGSQFQQLPGTGTQPQNNSSPFGNIFK
jgi:hypothetical protein